MKFSKQGKVSSGQSPDHLVSNFCLPLWVNPFTPKDLFSLRLSLSKLRTSNWNDLLKNAGTLNENKNLNISRKLETAEMAIWLYLVVVLTEGKTSFLLDKCFSKLRNHFELKRQENLSFSPPSGPWINRKWRVNSELACIFFFLCWLGDNSLFSLVVLSGL